MKLATSLRWLAIAIAIIAAIDPVITTRRRVDAVVAVMAADSAHSALAERVQRELGSTFTIVAAPFAGAAATVLVGDHVTPAAMRVAAAGFVVLPDPAPVALEAVHAPARVPLHARVPIVARITSNAQPTRATVTLLQHDVALDQVVIEIAPDTVVEVPLAFVPMNVGATPLRVSVTSNGEVAARGDVLIDVHDERWDVLFYELRPSWMSTFVRRALEQDPRFNVTSRTITSRDLATEYGRPPRRLSDLTTAAGYDALVIGAPEVMAASDIAALERWLRRSGGAAVLLPDREAAGPYQQLTGPGPRPGGGARPQIGPRAGSPPGSQPASQESGAAQGGAGKVSDEPHEGRIRRGAVGAGQLVVSTDYDSWRRRDPEVSDFDEFWRNLLAELAASTPPAIDVALARSLLRPGEWIEVNVIVRDVALSNDSSARTRVSATLTAADRRTPIRLWPGDRKGELTARVRAPRDTGSYSIDVTDGTHSARAPLLVSHDVVDARRPEPELLHAWASSRGGAVVSASSLDQLARRIERAVPAQRRAEAWHPMRSPWWILPFALALGVEWWMRRRRGLR